MAVIYYGLEGNPSSFTTCRRRRGGFQRPILPWAPIRARMALSDGVGFGNPGCWPWGNDYRELFALSHLVRPIPPTQMERCSSNSLTWSTAKEKFDTLPIHEELDVIISSCYIAQIKEEGYFTSCTHAEGIREEKARHNLWRSAAPQLFCRSCANTANSGTLLSVTVELEFTLQ